MRRLVLLISLLVTGVAAAGNYAGEAGWKEVEQSPEAKGMLDFHFTSGNDWWAAGEDYHSYSSSFSLSLKLREATSQSWWKRFCWQFSWLSDEQSCPPELDVKGKVYFNDSSNPLEGGSIWRGDNFIGYMYCAKDNSSCTLRFKGRQWGTQEGEDVWLKVKITFNEDRTVKFITGEVAEYFYPDEYFIIWHSRNLSKPDSAEGTP